MENYEKDLKENEKRNEKFLKVFEDWLKEKNLSPKTIKNHLSNADFYINDYLTYYEVTKMEEGLSSVDSFFTIGSLENVHGHQLIPLKQQQLVLKSFINV